MTRWMRKAEGKFMWVNKVKRFVTVRLKVMSGGPASCRLGDASRPPEVEEARRHRDGDMTMRRRLAKVSLGSPELGVAASTSRADRAPLE